MAASAPIAQRPFLDIAGGTNDLAQIGCCRAFAGYDRATGWGTLDVPRLARRAQANQ